MRVIPAFATVCVLAFAGAAFAQNQPATPPAKSDPAAAPVTASDPPATPDKPVYGKGWNAKKCADAKAKGKTIPDGACPADTPAAPK
jgi:hypothetical protein